MNVEAQCSTPELAAYYANRKLMWRNIVLIGICTTGWNMVLTIVTPLMALKLLESGMGEGVQGTLSSINSLLVSVLVMYFSWRSDHTVSRLGRRKPYLFLAAPFIILGMLMFSFNDCKWSLLIFMSVQMLFMDIKASTFPLLSIDCMPRNLLARMNSILGIAGGLMGFVSMRYAGMMLGVGDWLPYVLGAAVMTVTTICAYWIVEPPVSNPTATGFKIWSTFQVGWRDKRMIALMLGVGMVLSFIALNDTWSWFWARTVLGLEKKDIFEALSWCALANIALAYPVGWIIDRWGGLRVVCVYFALQTGCFLLAMAVHDKSSFTMLMMAASITAPLYGAADIMVYKTCDPKEVGSITATNSFVRNSYRGLLIFSSGWLIALSGQNYKLVFCLGIAMSLIGLGFLFLYVWMRRSVAARLADGVEMKPEAWAGASQSNCQSDT